MSPDAQARRVATVDVGTNTALLLIAEPAPGGMRVCATEDRFVRLGAGVDKNRMIQPEAMGRLRDALRAFRAIADEWSVADIVVAATSASRDARNGDELVRFVREETGLTYEIISGEEEALWSFNGALSGVPPRPGPVATLDIGGGSTERVLGQWDAGAGVWQVVDATSINVGSVRLTERFFPTQPPPAAAVAEAAAWVERELASADMAVPSDALLLGASGTTTSLALVEAGATAWSDLPDPLPRIDLARIGSWRERLLAMTLDEVLALNPAVMRGRADVFPAGVLILETVLRRAGIASLRAAHRGLRHGLALRYWRDHPAR
ncbi:MAG: exopolyphosphatase [Rhodothermales bacterium]